MQEFGLVHYWMLGIMFVMVVFLGAAVIGYFYNKKRIE